MFFLLRMGFWLALVVLLLPLGLKGENGQNVSVIDALGAFQAVVADARGFCERQPQACAVGGQMATHLMEKAQVGAKWLYEAVGEPADQSHPPAALAQPSHPGLGTSAMPSAGQLELTPQDLMPLWGGGEPVKPTAAIPRTPAGPAAAPGSAPLPPRRPA